jgi:hypothetical protein
MYEVLVFTVKKLPIYGDSKVETCRLINSHADEERKVIETSREPFAKALQLGWEPYSTVTSEYYGIQTLYFKRKMRQ